MGTIRLVLPSFFRSLLLVLTALFIGSCDLDQGLQPLNSGIRGTIEFLAPELRPPDVGEVRVAALLKFPPTGLGDLFFSEPLDFTGDSVQFELGLPPDEYTSLVLLWRRKGENWSFNSLLGVYGFLPPLQFELLPISVPDNATMVEGVDIVALWNFAATDSKIRGRIDVTGTPPADTEAILLAAFSRPPDFNNFAVSLLFLGGLPLPLDLSRTTLNYELRVFHNNYKFVGLFWKGESIPIEEMKLLGYYQLPDSTGTPGEVLAPEDGVISGIDFSIDYNTLPDGIMPPPN